MKMLSSIVDTCNVHINTQDEVISFKANGQFVVRKLDVKPFSNHAIVKVRYKNEYYLVDSKINNVEADVLFNNRNS